LLCISLQRSGGVFCRDYRPLLPYRSFYGRCLLSEYNCSSVLFPPLRAWRTGVSRLFSLCLTVSELQAASSRFSQDRHGCTLRLPAGDQLPLLMAIFFFPPLKGPPEGLVFHPGPGLRCHLREGFSISALPFLSDFPCTEFLELYFCPSNFFPFSPIDFQVFPAPGRGSTGSFLQRDLVFPVTLFTTDIPIP